jgi:hypothetical protein
MLRFVSRRRSVPSVSQEDSDLRILQTTPRLSLAAANRMASTCAHRYSATAPATASTHTAPVTGKATAAPEEAKLTNVIIPAKSAPAIPATQTTNTLWFRRRSLTRTSRTRSQTETPTAAPTATPIGTPQSNKPQAGSPIPATPTAAAPMPATDPTMAAMRPRTPARGFLLLFITSRLEPQPLLALFASAGVVRKLMRSNLL